MGDETSNPWQFLDESVSPPPNQSSAARQHSIDPQSTEPVAGEEWLASDEPEERFPVDRDLRTVIAGRHVDVDEREEASIFTFLVGYVVIIGAGVGFATLGNMLLGIHPTRMVCLFCGLLFAGAATGKPRGLYLVVRNAGWFHHIGNPALMRTILALLAFFLLAVGACAPNGALK